MLFLPFCNPVHPLFGASNCETYTYSFYEDAAYLLVEDFVSLPPYSGRVRTDLYTDKLFPLTSDARYQKVGVRFSSPNLVGEAFTRRNALTEDYAFGVYGRWKNLGGYAYRGSEYPFSGQGAFLSLSWRSLSLTGGVAEGGPTAGFQLGERFYLRGIMCAGKDTLAGVGLGSTGSSYDLFAVVGDGVMLRGTYVGKINALGEYIRSRKLNVGRLALFNRSAGVEVIGGTWRGYSGYELQTYAHLEWRLLKLKGALSVRNDSTYTYRVEAVPLPFAIRDVVLIEPTLVAYETPYAGWYSAGLSLTFYEDLTLALFYDLGTYDNGVRVKVVWTLWD